jgi:alkanesulfonate monooxygenase SsuD/methylene tetrahydromethanopterin reductase-like flavin-dependent oxidoreductase (luciferase family)
MGFATLASCAPGRVIAGLGTSSPIIVEGWYGRPFGHLVTTAGEFIAVLRQALAGTPVTFAGRQLSSAGFRATMKAPSPVPVLLAMNPAMLRPPGQVWAAEPGDVTGSRATITGVATALGLSA